jgi:hypothetical protein
MCLANRATAGASTWLVYHGHRWHVHRVAAKNVIEQTIADTRHLGGMDAGQELPHPVISDYTLIIISENRVPYTLVIQLFSLDTSLRSRVKTDKNILISKVLHLWLLYDCHFTSCRNGFCSVIYLCVCGGTLCLCYFAVSVPYNCLSLDVILVWETYIMSRETLAYYGGHLPCSWELL